MPSPSLDLGMQGLWMGSSSKPRPAGNLFDVFKHEVMLLKVRWLAIKAEEPPSCDTFPVVAQVNQTRMSRYMSQVVSLINRNAADMTHEVRAEDVTLSNRDYFNLCMY